MTFLTDFADQAVVLPLVAMVSIVLAILGWWRGALAWLAAAGVTFGSVLVLKVGFLACGPVFGPWALHSPSGHTAAAAMVAGGLTAIIAGHRWLALAAALLASAAIGMSRVALGFHSVPEVAIGGGLGFLGVMGLARFAGSSPVRRPVPLLVAAALVAVLLHGMRLPAEAAIWRASSGLLDFVPACRAEGEGPV